MSNIKQLRKWAVLPAFLCVIILFCGSVQAEETEDAGTQTARRERYELNVVSWIRSLYEGYFRKQTEDMISVTAESGYSISIDDSEELLSAEEKEQLLEVMNTLADYGNVAFESYSSHTSGEDYCTEQYRRKGFFDKSGTVFLIDMAQRHLWLYTGGQMEKTISARRAVSITDNVYRLASKGQYYDCVAEAFRQEAVLLEGGFILQPMRMICCFLIAFGICLLGVYRFICRERGIRSGLPERVISVTGKTALTGAASVTVTKRVVSDSGGGGFSGGGSSGGGGGGGGGGFSGGGHSF